MTKTLKKSKLKDREATEARLLVAAKEVFSQHGYQGATTRMIAQKAEVNLALINRYFDGKYGLLMALLKQQDMAYRNAPLKYLPQDNLPDEICGFGEFLYDEFFSDYQFSKIILGQFCSDEKFLKEFRSLFPMATAHPLFVERLQLLVAKKKMSAKLDLAKVATEVETAVFGMGTVDIIINGYDTKTAKKNIRSFLGRYSLALT